MLQISSRCRASARRLHASAARWVQSQVVLRQDVAGVGAVGDVVTVSPGYARNCLLPGRLAVPATASNRALAEQEASARGERQAAAAAQRAALNRQRGVRDEQDVADLAAVVKALTETPLVLRVLVDKAGAMRRPVDAAQLLRCVRQKKGVELPLESLPLDKPLSTLGEHALPLAFDTRHIQGKHFLTVLLKRKL